MKDNKFYYSFINAAFTTYSLKADYHLVKQNDECKVFILPDRMVIVFRESNDLDDWISNLRYSGKDYHKDLKKCADKFNNSLHNIISTHNPDLISLTGYSRGGGLAFLMTEFIIKKFSCIPLECVTFGQLKVLTEQKMFKLRKRFKTFNFNYRRVYIPRDIVIHTPYYYEHLKAKNSIEHPFIEEVKLRPKVWWYYLNPFYIWTGIKSHELYRKVILG